MEVMGSVNEMEDEAVRLFTIYKEAATIKLPMTRDGLQDVLLTRRYPH